MVTLGQPVLSPRPYPKSLLGRMGNVPNLAGAGAMEAAGRTADVTQAEAPGAGWMLRPDCVPLSHHAGDAGRAPYPPQSSVVLWVLTGVGGGVRSLRSPSPRCAMSS